MLLGKKKERDSEIPMASLADIAFLLIVYFMLATTFQTTFGFETEVPQGEKAAEDHLLLRKYRVEHQCLYKNV